MSLPSNKTVVVGMSGGVDSSLTAWLLKEKGYRVIALFMKNWEEKDDQGICHSTRDYEDVTQVCDKIGIPCYSVNFSENYLDQVFSQFLDELKKGRTPNPDILCNREIKFKVLFEKALEYGADFLATGHYAQIDDQGRLLKGIDPGKDQSYFLYAVNGKTFNKVLFPVGELHKSEVRRLSREAGLPTSEKKDSTGICFIGKRDFSSFIKNYVGAQPGVFETLSGKRMGTHVGTAYYTMGQRHGMGLGGPGEPWFVVGKDIERSIVYVEQGTRHPGLYSDSLVANELTWIQGFPPKMPLSCTAKIRYRQNDQLCNVFINDDGQAHVNFLQPQRAITPGQSIVFYDGNCCLGGGIIDRAGPSYYERGESLPLIVAG